MEILEENTEEFEGIEVSQKTEEFQATQDEISLTDIHKDLGIIFSVLIFFVLVIILKYTYRFFNMIFKF